MTDIQKWWQYHREYYYDAFIDEYKQIWRGIDIDSEELYWRCYYRALAVFLQSDPQAIVDRRRLLYAYCKAEFKTDYEHDTLNRYRKQLPIDSRVRRVVRNICSAYDEAPERVWTSDAMQGLYESMKIETSFPRIYTRARMTGLVMARPVYLNGKWHVDFMTPDQFTITTDPDDWRTVTSITYPQGAGDGIEYVTWTADTVARHDYAGREIASDDNPYGRIPWIALRLGDDDGVYPGGMFELMEGQLDVNKGKWLSTVNLTFAGQPVWVAVNMGSSNLTFSPDKVIQLEGVRAGEGMDVPPELVSVAPESAYQMIDDHARLREQMMQQAEGIPASMVRDSDGEPPSGVARLIERQELAEIRYSDQKALRSFEVDFAIMASLVARTDAGMSLPDVPLESVAFAEESVMIEPADEYALDKMKLADLVISPEQFYRKWGGISEDSLTAEIARRRAWLAPASDASAASVE